MVMNAGNTKENTFKYFNQKSSCWFHNLALCPVGFLLRLFIDNIGL